jgi:hypothetical protein
LDAGIGELTDDEGLAWAEGVVEDAGDLDSKGFDLVTLKNGPDFAVLAGFDFGEWERSGVGGLSSERGCEGEEEGRDESGELKHEASA